MDRKGILAAGNWALDKVKMINHWPEQDTLSLIENEEIGGGGSPFNLIIGMARLSPPFPLEALGLLGRDEAGKYLLNQCRRHGIRTQQMLTTPNHPTSYTEVMTIRANGRRTFFHHPGANAHLEPRHFNPKKTSARIFHLGHLLLLNKLDSPDSQYGTRAARVLAMYRKAGIKTNIDIVSELSNRLKKVLTPALKHADYCIVNELEAGHATSTPTRRGNRIHLSGVRKAAEKIFLMGVHELVVIHFPEGAYALNKRGDKYLQPSLKLPEGYNKGAVGAGDAFCGGMLFGLHEKWPIQECLKLAVCNAAACLSHPTATEGIRPLKKTLNLLKKYGCRKIG